MTGENPSQRGLTLRSVVVAVVALLLMAIWIQYEEVYNTYGGPLAENSPPNSAVGVVLGLLAISALLYRLRRALRLAAAELVVIYAALVLAAPLMTQGLWHRIIGLITAFPHYQDFKSYDNLPPMLWPHGVNLIPNADFAAGLEGYRPEGVAPEWREEPDRQGRPRRMPVLRDGALAVTLPRSSELVPGERFLWSARVRASGLAKDSVYYLELQADDQPPQALLLHTQNTMPSFADPAGFARVGVCPVTVPPGLRERLTLRVGIRGAGELTVQEWEFLNVEAVESLFSGRSVVRASRWDSLPEDQREATVVRPDNLWSLAGLRYLASGFIPWDQWATPLAAWSGLIAALFVGFLGLNILLRKQWVEHERFTFPLTIVPKNLFATETQADGRVVTPLFRNRVMWAGFGAAFLLALLKGLNFYIPQVPAPAFPEQGFASYVTSPALKAFFQNVNFGLGFSLTVLPILLLIETDILFSLWTMFLLFQLWHLFGKVFGWTAAAGYPWEFQQAMGAFIAYAVLALFVARHHLARVGRIILGRATATERTSEAHELFTYRTAVWLVLASLLALGVWGWWTQMGIGASLLFFGYILVCGFAASRLRAECGAPFAYLTPYFGMQFVAAVGGFAVFQSTGMVVATIAAGFMCTSCFLFIAPVQVEMMELGRHFRVRPRDVGAGLLLGLAGGLVLGGFVILCWAYGFGVSNLKTQWPFAQNWYFEGYRTGALNADRAFAAGTLGKTPETQPLNFRANPDAKGLGIGAVMTGVLAFLRAQFPWFPFHPLGYVLASSHFMRGVWLLVFLAWLARLVLFRLGGAGVIRRGLVPAAVGMFLGAVTSVMVFGVVGIVLRLQGVTEVYAKMP